MLIVCAKYQGCAELAFEYDVLKMIDLLRSVGPFSHAHCHRCLVRRMNRQIEG